METGHSASKLKIKSIEQYYIDKYKPTLNTKSATNFKRINSSDSISEVYIDQLDSFSN